MIVSLDTSAPATEPEQTSALPIRKESPSPASPAASKAKPKAGKTVDKSPGESTATTFFKSPSTVSYRNGGIYIFGNKNTICVADNFQIFMVYDTEDEDGQKTWILKIVVRGRSEPQYVEVTHDEFCSATKLKNKLAGYRLALKITSEYMGELCQHLFSQPFPSAIKVTRLGFHAESGVYFFANKAVDPAGTTLSVLDPDEFGIVTARRGGESLCLSMPVVSKKKQHLFTLHPGTLNFNAWFTHLASAHRYDNAIIPACFYLMSLFRDIVVRHTSASPILYLKGGPSSGKSSIAKSLSRLYNVHEAAANLKSKNTEAGLVRVMSLYANGLIWMDEFHNEFQHVGLLQSAYDDNGYIRAQENSSRGVDTVDIYSALALTSNYIPEKEIFFSRCVFLPIAKSTFTAGQVDAFNRLKDIEQNGLSCVTLEMLTHRPLIEKGFRQAYDDLYTGLKAAIADDTVIERLIANMARVLSVAYILQLFGKIQLHFDVEGDDDILTEFVSIGSKAILRQHQLQREKTALSEFFELLQHQYEQGYLQAGVHYRFEHDQIYLRFPALYMLYVQRCWQTFRKAPAERDTLRQELMGLEGSDNDKFFHNIRFSRDAADKWTTPTRAVSDSCSVTYAKLVDIYTIDWMG